MKSIMELAEQAGFEIDCCSLQWHERIERFAHLVRAQALEEAATRCDQILREGKCTGASDAAIECAVAIRALKEST
jgi:uncharacterized heparinase superfamily protein